ncbi:hypothetical protein D3C87_1917240 [compost metagenome]
MKIQLHLLNETLFIRIQNSYHQQVRKDRLGELISAKTDKYKHGIGLKSVKKVITECGGIWDISYENQIFQIEVCLFNIRPAQSSIL